MNLVTAETRQRLQAHHPGAAAEIDKLEGILDDTNLSPELLALCGAYFHAALRGDDWCAPDSPTELESACLDVCEQFMVSVPGVTDEQIAALNRHLGADDVYNLMSAIYLIEMSKRLDMTLERVLQ
jgi:hypothetical protein